MKMIVGSIVNGEETVVRLQPVDKKGEPVGEPLESPAFDVNGVLSVDERGQVVLVEKTAPKENSGAAA